MRVFSAMPPLYTRIFFYLFIGCFLHIPAAFPAGTQANTTITNTATVDYILAGTPVTSTASVTIAIDELIDVNVSWQNAANISVMSPSTAQMLTFLITNTGNGLEEFILSVATGNTPPQFDPGNIRLWADTDRDGTFNSNNDTQLPLGDRISLNGGSAGNDSMLVFVLSDIPAGLSNNDLGDIQLTATSVTASANAVAGNSGAIMTAAGDGGAIDAIVGMSGAQSSTSGTYQVVPNIVTISKSAIVRDNRGGNAAYPGSVITYTLNVDVAGSAPVNNLVITDIIPANTTFNTGVNSIRLDGVLQTNAADAPQDFSEFDSNSNMIRTDLSQGGMVSIVPPAVFVISFDVIIN